MWTLLFTLGQAWNWDLPFLLAGYKSPRRSQKIQDQEREDAINQNRESLLEVRKENEMLLQRVEKSEKLESELRLLLKDSENEGARLIAKIETSTADSPKNKRKTRNQQNGCRKNLKTSPQKSSIKNRQSSLK